MGLIQAILSRQVPCPPKMMQGGNVIQIVYLPWYRCASVGVDR